MFGYCKLRDLVTDLIFLPLFIYWELLENVKSIGRDEVEFGFRLVLTTLLNTKNFSERASFTNHHLQVVISRKSLVQSFHFLQYHNFTYIYIKKGTNELEEEER